MAAAALGPRHPPLRHLHRRERESPIWGRRMVCWFTSTRGRTSQSRMESIRSATGILGFWMEAWANRLERSRAIRGVAVLCADRLYLSLIPAIIVAVVFHPVALFPCTFVALVSIATILPPAITVTPSSNKTVTGRTRRKAAGMPPALKGCSKRYERFCQKYRHHSKGAPKCHWGSRMLKRLVETSGSRSKSKRISPGQTQLPFAFDLRLSQIPADCHQIAVRFRRANGIRDGDRERSIW